MNVLSGRVLFGFAAFAAAAHAQSFDGGSTGADGALALTTPGIVQFDPRAFSLPLNPTGDNVYHFASIYIGPGVTVKMSSKFLTGPIFWLSQGPVRIDGTIDLDGAEGEGRTPALAGAGGYPGGTVKGKGYHPEAFAPNAFLVPLVGGFGGDGGETQGGGAGGGALLIASSASITINGAITANGGASLDGTGGGGGSLRLVAPVIDGTTGLLNARGGLPGGADGRIRFETLDNRFGGSLNETPFSIGKPFGLFLPPKGTPSVRVVSVNGVSVTKPEFTVNRASTTVIVEAHNIPPGTAVQLEVFQENGSSQTVATTPLLGTFELSRATASLALPRGKSQAYVKAAWRQPATK